MPESHTRRWPWPEAEVAATADDQLDQAMIACFASPAGRVVIGYLRRHVLERRVPPSASDAELRHVEGQRALAGWLIAGSSRARPRTGPGVPSSRLD